MVPRYTGSRNILRRMASSFPDYLYVDGREAGVTFILSHRGEFDTQVR
jgi:hypothetical protein